MQIVFRVDASSKIATGHVMRCLTLAAYLQQQGHQVLFVCRPLENNLIDLIEAQGFIVNTLPEPDCQLEQHCHHADWLETTRLVDAQQTIAVLPNCVDWLIVDHYALDAAWERALRPHVKSIMIIDDLADRPHDCDVLVDQNAYLQYEERYMDLVPETCVQLLGPGYALLRPEFSKLAAQSRAISQNIRRILVCYGGIDIDNYTLKALQAIECAQLSSVEVDVVVGQHYRHVERLAAYCAEDPNINLHQQTKDMAQLMVQADLFIGAGGTTLWERGVLGVASLVQAIANNQKQLVADFAKQGCIYSVAHHLSAAQLAIHIRALADNWILRQCLSEKSRVICGRHGVARIARRLQDPPLQLRQAQQQDSQLIWQLRNQKTVRANSLDQAEIPIVDHNRWLQRVLHDDHCLLLIAEMADDAMPIGVIRFDIQGATAVVSLYLSEQYFGQGFGARILKDGECYLAKEQPQVTTIHAIIKSQNDRSVRLFQAQGYLAKHNLYQKELV